MKTLPLIPELVLLAALAHAQTPPSVPVPKFEAASIKPCSPADGAGGGRAGKSGGGGRNFSRSPGRININCMSVADIIDAYLIFGGTPHTNDLGLPFDPRRIRGGPAWMRSDRYTIAAVATDPVASGPTGRGTPADNLLMGPMLLALLEERFQLKLHRELEEVPAYALTLAKGGLRIKPTVPESCAAMPGPGSGPIDDTGPGGKPWCLLHGGWKGPNWTMEVTGKKLSDVANMLGGLMLGRPVADKTGTTDVFTFVLEFAHDESAPGDFPPGFPSPFTATDEPGGASIFTALDKLGLKLAPDKAQKGYVVVDHIERPSEN